MGGGNEELDVANSDDELTRKIFAEASQLDTVPTESQLDDWSADISAKAVSNRQKDLGGLSDMTGQLDLNGDDDVEDHEDGGAGKRKNSKLLKKKLF